MISASDIPETFARVSCAVRAPITAERFASLRAPGESRSTLALTASLIVVGSGSLERRQLLNSQRAKPEQRLFGAPQDRIRVALSLVVGAEQNDFLARDLSCNKVKQLERRCIGPLKILED